MFLAKADEMFSLRHAQLFQCRLCMEWNLPKQTMNSAVASMVKQGLLELEPTPGRYSGKLLHLPEICWNR